MEAATQLALRLRAAANDRLARHEPLLLVAAPLLALIAARAVHAAAADVADRGLRTVLITLAMAAVKLVPGVSGYIAAQKSKVVEQLQSGSASSKKNLRNELPAIGIPSGVINELQALKDKDVRWQGKCFGTVYISGSESEGHFALINKAYSMIIAESAHSAYDKAAQYLNIKVRRVPVNKEFLADVKGFRRCINGNTIMMVGSAPGFPHG